MIIRVLDEDGTLLSDDIVPWLVDPYTPLIGQIEEGLLRLHWRSLKNRSVPKTTALSSSTAEHAMGHVNGGVLSEAAEQYSRGNAYSQIAIEAAARQLFVATRSPTFEGNEGGDTPPKKHTNEGWKVEEDAVPSLSQFLSAFAFVIPIVEEVSGRKIPEVSFLPNPTAASHEEEDDIVRVRMMEQIVFNRNVLIPAANSREGRGAGPQDGGAHPAPFSKGLAGGSEGPVMRLRRRAFDTTSGSVSGISLSSQSWGDMLLASHRRGSTAADRVVIVNPYPFDSCQAFLERRRVLKSCLQELESIISRRCRSAPHTNVALFLLPDVVDSNKHDPLALSLLCVRHAVVEELAIGTYGIVASLGGANSGSGTNTGRAAVLNASHIDIDQRNCFDDTQRRNNAISRTPMGLVDDVAFGVAEAPSLPPIFILDVTRTPYELGLRAGSALLLASRSQIEAIAKAYHQSKCQRDSDEGLLHNESSNYDYYYHHDRGLLTEKSSRNARSVEAIGAHHYSAVVGSNDDAEDGICEGDGIELGEEAEGPIGGIHDDDDEGHERGGVSEKFHVDALVEVQRSGVNTGEAQVAAAAFGSADDRFVGLSSDVGNRHPLIGHVRWRLEERAFVGDFNNNYEPKVNLPMFDGERKTELDLVHIVFSEDAEATGVDPARSDVSDSSNNRSVRAKGTVSSSPHERGQSIATVADSITRGNIYIDDDDDDDDGNADEADDILAVLGLSPLEKKISDGERRRESPSFLRKKPLTFNDDSIGEEVQEEEGKEAGIFGSPSSSSVVFFDSMTPSSPPPPPTPPSSYDASSRARSTLRRRNSSSPSSSKRVDLMREDETTVGRPHSLSLSHHTSTLLPPASTATKRLFSPLSATIATKLTTPNSILMRGVGDRDDGRDVVEAVVGNGDVTSRYHKRVGGGFAGYRREEEDEVEEAFLSTEGTVDDYSGTGVGLRKMAEGGILESASARFFGGVSNPKRNADEQETQTASVEDRARQAWPDASNKHEDQLGADNRGQIQEKRPLVVLGRGGDNAAARRMRQPLLSVSPDTSEDDDENEEKLHVPVHEKGSQRHEVVSEMTDQRPQGGGAFPQSTRHQRAPTATALSGPKRRKVRFSDPFFAHKSAGSGQHTDAAPSERDDYMYDNHGEESDIDDYSSYMYHHGADAISIDLSSYLPEEKRETEKRKDAAASGIDTKLLREHDSMRDGRQLYADYAPNTSKHVNNANSVASKPVHGVGSRPAAPRRDRRHQTSDTIGNNHNNYPTITNISGSDTTDHLFGLHRHANETTVIEMDDDVDDDEKEEQRATTTDVQRQRYASLSQESGGVHEHRGAEESGKLTASRKDRAATTRGSTKASSARGPSPYQAALAAIAQAKQSAASFGGTTTSAANSSSLQRGPPTVSKADSFMW